VTSVLGAQMIHLEPGELRVIPPGGKPGAHVQQSDIREAIDFPGEKKKCLMCKCLYPHHNSPWASYWKAPSRLGK
jgi:hypothetical protein